MKKQLKWIVIGFLVFSGINCSKNSDSPISSCESVSITNSAPGCGGWGIVVKGTKYPSGNIPQEFKTNGIDVCAKYTLYEDMRMCVCCGGTWADIKSMSKQH